MLISVLTDAIRGQGGTPEPVILALQEPKDYLPLILRLIAPGDSQLHEKIDSQWEALNRECALCGAHVLHENLDESTRRDLPSHLLKDLLSAAATAYDARKLDSIPTRSVRPGKGHTEREVVTQTAYGLGIVSAMQAVKVGPGVGGGGPADLARALAYILPPAPQGLNRLPLVHVQALGSQRRKGEGNHFIGVEAADLGKGEIHLLDNGERFSMPIQQFQRQYFPTGKLLVHPDQYGILEAMGFPMASLAEGALLDTVGDCGTCAFKGDFPVGYHEPVEWGLVSAARLLYRGADGGSVQVRYTVGDALYIRSYRVAYNSAQGSRLAFRVEEIGPDQKRLFLAPDETYNSLDADKKFGYKPDTIKRKMAEMLRMLAYEPKFKLPDNAKILDVVTHFRWATHGFSEIKGTHPHQARPEEIVGRTLQEPVAKTITVAHNGIIYGYNDLGIELEALGHTFESTVDTERYAHLLYETIQQQRPPTLLEAVRRVNDGRIQPNATYGFQITSADYPDEVVSARNESPIYVGIGEVTLKEGGKPIPFFMTAAAPGAILPHTEVLSRTLLPDKTVVQLKNGEITAINLKNQRYYLALPGGTLSSGKRADGHLAPEQVYIQELHKDSEIPLGPQQPYSTLTSAQMTRYAKGDVKLKVWASSNGQPAEEMAGLIIFQREKDIPEVYNLGDYPDYTTKELYESGDSMRRTLNRNAKLVPVFYIPRPSAGKKLEAGEVKAYRPEHVRRQTSARTVTLTAEQAASIGGKNEWTELVKLPSGEYAYVKLVPNIVTPMYESLYLPEFPDIPSWDELREVEEVWGVSVGSSYFQDLDGYDLIKRYARIGVRTFNSDDLRDDEFWVSNAAHKKVIAVMATTQSGATAVTRENMKKIKEASGTDAVGGARLITIADTNTPGSDITTSAYTELLVREGSLPEIAVLSTKAVHSQKTNKELFGMRLGIERRVMRPEAAHERIMELKEESRQVDEVLRNPEIEARMRKIAEEGVHTNIEISAYRGFQGIAAEHGIKAQEGGEIFSMLFNMGTFLHGPGQLLAFSGVPEGGTAEVKAQFDTRLKRIVTDVEYHILPGAMIEGKVAEDKLRGLPIVAFYVPSEGDRKVRDRLESNFQEVISRGASVYVFTSPEYAKELLGKKAKFGVRPEDRSTIYVPMVKEAIGIPANPYTLTALGQKMALLYADIKNKELAEPLFERAAAIYEAQDEAAVPAAYPSREEWLRQALVEAYRKIEEFRANGRLGQVIHQETVGYTLWKINEAAKNPGDRKAVDEARDLTSQLVNFIDVAQPSNLAKSVTVEAGAEELELSFSEVAGRIRDSIKRAYDKADTDLDWGLLESVHPWLEAMGMVPTVRYGDPWEGRPVLENPPTAASRPFFYQDGQAGRPLALVPAYDVGKKGQPPQRILFVVQRGDFLTTPHFWALPVDSLLKGRLEGVLKLLGVVPAVVSVEQVTQNLLQAFEEDGKDHFQIVGQGEESAIVLVGPNRQDMIEAITHPVSAVYGWEIDKASAPENLKTARGEAGIVQIIVHEPLAKLEEIQLRETIRRNLARDPKFLVRFYSEVRSLIDRHKKDGGALFATVEQTEPIAETTLITVADQGEISGLHHMIGGRVNIHSADVEPLPEGRAVSIVTLEGSEKQWAEPIADLHRQIDALFKFSIEFEAALYLSRKPKTDADVQEIKWLKGLFISYQMGGVSPWVEVEETETPPSVDVLAIAPVQVPQPSLAADLVKRIGRRSKARGQEIAPTLSPVETIQDPVTNKPLVLVTLRFEGEGITAKRLEELGVTEVVENMLSGTPEKVEENEELALVRDFLVDKKNRSPEEAKWLAELYGQYMQNPGAPAHRVIEGPNVGPQITFVAMVIPYTSAPAEQEPVAALGGWVRDIERGNRLPMKALLRRLFVAEYQESTDTPLVAFAQVGFTRAIYNQLVAEKKINFVQEMLDTLAPYFPASKAQAGVEAQFLTWDEELAAHDPVAEIKRHTQTSEVLRSIREVNQGAWKVAPSLRGLSVEEIAQLQAQGNWAVNWNQVQVASDMPETELAQIRKNDFYGAIEIGRIGQGTLGLPSGIQLPMGIRNSVFYGRSKIAANVAIEGAILQGQVVKPNAAIRDSVLVLDGSTTFGLETEVGVSNEAAKRKIQVYPEMNLKSAIRLSEDRTGDLQDAYEKVHAEYVKAAVSEWGIVEEGVIVESSPLILNVFLGKGVMIDRALEVQNAVITGGFTAGQLAELQRLASKESKDQNEEPKLLVGLTPSRLEKLRSNPDAEIARLTKERRTKVDRGAIIRNITVQSGVHVSTLALAQSTLLMENAEVGEGAKLLDVILGPDAFAGKSELGSMLGEMGFTTHHQPSSVLALYARHGANIGSGTLIANHRGYGPWLEVKWGAGMFAGTNSVWQANINFLGAPHSLISTSTLVQQDQTVTMPFTLIRKLPVVEATRFGSGLAGFNEIQPGWVLLNSLYLVMRNEWKWNKRQKALLHRKDFDIFQPETVDLMVEAVKALENVPRNRLTQRPITNYFVGERPTERDVLIKGLGKSILRGDKRDIAVIIYNIFIRYYALQEMFRQLDSWEKAGRLDQLPPDWLTTPSKNKRWEHARQLLLRESKEFSDARKVGLPALLAEYAEKRAAMNGQLLQEMKDELKSFVEEFGEAAQGVLPPAGEDSFIKDFQKDTGNLLQQVQALLPKLGATADIVKHVQELSSKLGTTAGLEQTGGPAIGLLPARTTVADPALQEAPARAGREVPPEVARILELLGEFRDATVESGVYGLVFAEPAGLAVGVTLSAVRDQDGNPLARRYVAASEAQEQTLLDLGVAAEEIVRVWEFQGDIEKAIEVAKDQLVESRGAVVLDPIRGVTADFARFMQQIRDVEVLLTPRDYSPESAARAAQRVYALFV